MEDRNVRRVYQFGLRPPTSGDRLVREQLRAAHDYQNDLVAIERGRRSALRAVDDTDEVHAAIETVKAATKSSRLAAVTALRAARREARGGAADEIARIDDLDKSLRRDARALTTCFWGSYLDVEARHMQSRQQPLYGDDTITPNDPSFRHGPRWRDSLPSGDPRGVWWLTDGQLGVQLQKGLATRDALDGHDDTRVRLVLDGKPGSRGRRYGVLWLRIGSEGRDPVWAKWPIKLHRAVPDVAIWKWVRVSVARDGMRERWTCEITVDDPAPMARSLDRDLAGVIAVEWEWSALESGGVRVARWADSRGATGEVVLPSRVVEGIRKPDGMRAVRDLVLNEAQPNLARELRATKESLPGWLREAANTLHLWRSHDRFRALEMRWRGHATMVPAAYAILRAWVQRDAHLYYYEVGARGQALGQRREFYRLLAAEWARRYRTILMSDQDLSREARWGDDSDLRFTVGLYELRSALRNAFGGDDAVESRWRGDKPDEDDERLWCERTRDAWMAGGARGDGRFAARKEKTTNAWATRKAKAAMKRAEREAAREPARNEAE
jgi:hypothetical protein